VRQKVGLSDFKFHDLRNYAELGIIVRPLFFACSEQYIHYCDTEVTCAFLWVIEEKPLCRCELKNAWQLPVGVFPW
jgi:hypothetical protein